MRSDVWNSVGVVRSAEIAAFDLCSYFYDKKGMPLRFLLADISQNDRLVRNVCITASRVLEVYSRTGLLEVPDLFNSLSRKYNRDDIKVSIPEKWMYGKCLKLAKKQEQQRVYKVMMHGRRMFPVCYSGDKPPTPSKDIHYKFYGIKVAVAGNGALFWIMRYEVCKKGQLAKDRQQALV